MTGPTFLASAVGGALVTFEGPEGSGKSTQIRRLAETLLAGGSNCVITREPGGTPAGDRIRGILLERSSSAPQQPETELFLMLAQRNEHLHQKILPALRSGAFVICDRYFDSTMAYQGYARGIDIRAIRSLHEQYLRCFLPDLTIVLDIDPGVGLQRAAHGGRSALDRLESEALEFHQRVRQGFLDLAQAEPQRFFVIDAGDTPDAVAQTIYRCMAQRFPGRLP